MRRAILFFLLVTACAKAEKPATDLIHEVASEVSTKPRIEMDVRLPQDQPAPADLALQRSIEDRIEREHVGRLVTSGTGPGFLYITVEVEQTANAIETLRRVARDAGVLERTSFKVKEAG
jgi:hypothetical protein